MAKSSTSTLAWQNIDVATLPPAIAKQYARYKETYAEMKAERLAFEQAAAALVSPPAGKRVVFGYNFGKLSVALADDDAKPTKATGGISLSSLLR